MTKKDIAWRLPELPNAEGVAALVQQKVITPEEARGILLKDEKQSKDEKIKGLEEQVEFLKDLVETLSSNRNQISTIYYPRVVESKPWWGPSYTYLCSAVGNSGINMVSTSASNMSVSTVSSNAALGALGAGRSTTVIQ